MREIGRGEDAPASATAADLDNDGDLDILAVLLDAESIVWYENVGGTFSGRFVGRGDDPFFAAPADIDDDGDLDVVVGSEENAILAWFENSDGLGNFMGADPTFGNVVLEMVERSDAGSLVSRDGRAIATADIDGDGDVDLLAGYLRDAVGALGSAVVWLENTEGVGTFSPPRVVDAIVSDDAPGSLAASSLQVADVDGDGDADLLAGFPYDNTVAWYENIDGSGTFGQRPILSRDLHHAGRVTVLPADLDKDGDLDVVASSSVFRSIGLTVGDNRIIWIENLDGRGSFGAARLISTLPSEPTAIDVKDLDGDGDLDVISANFAPGGPSSPGNSMTWFEHLDGRGTFGPPMRVVAAPVGSDSAHAVDLDQDGDLDVLMGGIDFDRDRIAYYEQRILGDVDDDGQFDSSDLVAAFQAGKYEDGRNFNASFEQGDWNGDGDFDTRDLVFAFQAGHYDRGAARAVDVSLLGDVAAAQRHRTAAGFVA